MKKSELITYLQSVEGDGEVALFIEEPDGEETFFTIKNIYYSSVCGDIDIEVGE